jgi:hypothetical protein
MSADSSPISSALSAINENFCEECEFFDEKVSSTVFQPAKCTATDDTRPHSSLDLHRPIAGKSLEEHQLQESSID